MVRQYTPMKYEFDVLTGLSDHTLGIAASVAAVTLGACIVEKHLTLSRSDGGVDSAFSAEPQELKLMVESIRSAEQSLGEVFYGVGAGEEESVVFRRSLFVVEDVTKGDSVTGQNVRSIRPGYGLAPRYFDQLNCRVFGHDVERGTPVTWDMFVKSGEDRT